MFFKIGEFANKIGVSPSTLRNWERRGWLVPHHVAPSGYRYYSEEQFKQVTEKKLVRGNNSADGS